MQIRIYIVMFCALLTACSEIEQKGGITIGNRQINVPIPTELTLVTPQMTELYKHYEEEYRTLEASSNGVLRFLNTYSMLGDLDDDKRIVGRYCLIGDAVKINNLPATQDVDKSMLAKLKQGIQLKNEQSAEKLNQQTKEYFNKQNQDIKKNTGKPSENNSPTLGKSYELIGYNKNAFAVMRSIEIEEQDNKTQYLASFGFIELRGRILATYCYADLNEQEWLRNTTLNWFIELDKANK